MERGDLAELVKKNTSQVMIFLPHYMWAKILNVLFGQVMGLLGFPSSFPAKYQLASSDAVKILYLARTIDKLSVYF